MEMVKRSVVAGARKRGRGRKKEWTEQVKQFCIL